MGQDKINAYIFKMPEKQEFKVLKRNFYARPTDVVAQEVLGKVLVRIYRGKVLSGRIVETEAYFGPGDIASHARNGPTPRSQPMFGLPGRAYVYFTYGMHYLLNLVTEEDGKAGAVLIRALEPLEGLEVMKVLRNKERKRDLTSGPARLTQALAIDLSFNCWDLTTGQELFLVDDGYETEEIVFSARIGVPVAPSDNFRYYIKGNLFVSRL